MAAKKKTAKRVSIELEEDDATAVAGVAVLGPESAAEFVPIDAIHPWEKNPDPPTSRHVREVAKSIERFTFTEPIIARRENGEIIAGHARYFAAQKLKLETVPVRFVDLSEGEAHALALADNKIASNRKRDWTGDDVAEILEALERDGIDIENGTGFSDRELDALLEEVETGERGPKKPSPAEGSIGPVTWVIHHGEALDYLRSLPDGSVDAIITDPPYSSGGFTRGDRTGATGKKYVQTGMKIEGHHDFGGDNRDQRSFVAWCAIWLTECLRIAKPGAPICVFCDWRQLPAMTDAVQAGGFIWRGIVPWDKTEGTRPQMGRFRAQCEYVVFGSSGPMSDGKDVGVLPGLVRESVKADDKHHQTGKPTEVMRFLARVCPPRGVILDPFAGSGSTGVGALLEGRSFLGCEQSPEYAEVARRRLGEAAEEADEVSTEA